MADLIDRKAVLDYLDLREHDATERDWRSGANEIARIRKAIAALSPAEAGGVDEPISDARLECEALCASFLAGVASEKEVVDTIQRVARANERLAVLAGKNKQQMRLETDMEHIARDMREARFPTRSEPQMVPAAPAPVEALVKAADEWRDAQSALNSFEAENPGDSTKRWANLLLEKERAEQLFWSALATIREGRKNG